MPEPQDLTNGDQATAMADLTSQLATLIKAVGQFVQNPAQVPSTTSPTVSSGTSQLIESIATRIPNFSYDPEEDKTFDRWWNRYEDIITKDGSSLTDDAKVRFVLSKLESKEYSHFSNRVLPATPNSFKFEELIPKLKETFKSTSSVFRKRQEFLRMEYDGSSIEEYTGLVLRRFTSSEFKKMTDDQTCCMVWINGLRDSAYTDIRTKALQILESKPTTTLLELEKEIKRLLDIREDSRSVCRAQQTAEVNAINRTSHTDKSQKSQKPPPPLPCFKCSENHWANECEKKVTCHICQKSGHIAKFCRSNLRGSESPRGNINSVIIGSTTHSKVNRIYRTVSVNGKPLKMQLDTGADVTLISTKDWIRLGRPSLQTPTIQVKSANHQPIVVKGTFQCQFELNGTSASGMAHVTGTRTLLGTDWLSKDSNLWQILHANQISKGSSSVGSACNYLDNKRGKLKAELNKQFSKHQSTMNNNRGIRHLQSAPVHPQSNGQGRFVATRKRELGKLKGEENKDTASNVFLQNYRSTTCSSSPDGSTPAENFHGRKIRTSQDQLLPNDQLPVSHDTEMKKQFNKQHGARRRNFTADEKVYVKDYRNINTATWIPGTIQKRIGRTSYRVLVKDTVWIRYANLLRRRDNKIHSDVPQDQMDPIDVTPTPSPTSTSFTAPPVPMPRKSTRITRQPQRLVVKPNQKSYT
ncbi:unnamed protein product [Caenorhabditis nigoni]